MITNKTIRLAWLPLILALLTLACGRISVGVEEPTPALPSPTAMQIQPGGESDQPTPLPASEIGQSDDALPTPEDDRGFQLAYVKDGNVWLWEQGAGAKQLTSAGQVSQVLFSPDGGRIAFRRQVGEVQSEIWVVNVDGSGERSLVTVADLDALEADKRNPESIALVPHTLAWIPGTHILAYNTQQIYQGPGLDIMNDLRLVDADSLQKTTLLPAGEGGEFYFSPDGALVAVVTPTTIDILNLDGTERERALEYPEAITYSEYRYYPLPAWSPDATFLRVVIPPSDPLAPEPGAFTLWQIPTDGQASFQLGSVETLPFAVYAPRFSPDLSRIAYNVQVGAPEDQLWEVRIASYDGKDAAAYAQGYLAQFVDWAGSAEAFVYTQGDPAQLDYVRIGGADRPISPAGQSFLQTSWIDAERYLYLKDINAAWELGIGALDGANVLVDNIPGLPPSFDFTR